MSKPPVEVVVINWKRPENVTRILRAFREGSVPCTITLCDVHGAEEFAPKPEALALADRVYRWTHNMRSYNRYVPLGGYDHEYTLFQDDDNLPGSRCLENLLDHASGKRIGVLGEAGRRLPRNGRYSAGDSKRRRSLEEVDLIVQSYFVRSRNLGHVPIMRHDYIALTGLEPIDDDIMLAIAMQRAGLGCWLVPKSADPETSVRMERLPDPFAMSESEDHLRRRAQVFADARKLGWRPLWQRPASSLRHVARALRN